MWEETSEVIIWFKDSHKFITFDIKDFYPLITVQFLTNSLNFAKTMLSISADDKKIKYHAINTTYLEKQVS